MTMRRCMENSVYYENQFLCRRHRIYHLSPLLYRSSLLDNYQSTINELQYNDEVVEKLSKLSLKSLKI